MTRIVGRGTRLDQEQRGVLLDLLLQGEGAEPFEWSNFWQGIFSKSSEAKGNGLEVLAAVFDEGISQIAAAGFTEESLISRWIGAVVREAESRGINQLDLSERLLTWQVSKQLGQRDSGRPQTWNTHVKILAAALEVFSVKGFHGATVDEVAEHAGLGKGTVYRHFNSKKGLFSELIRSKVAELEQAVSSSINPEDSVLEIIETYLRTYFAFFDRNRKLYKVLIQEQSDFGAEVKALYIGNILKKVPLLRLKILHAAKDGRLKQMDFHTVFYGVMGFVDGVMQKWLASEQEYSLADEVPTVLETVFYGFVSPDPP